jgi:hypothetical protein
VGSDPAADDAAAGTGGGRSGVAVGAGGWAWARARVLAETECMWSGWARARRDRVHPIYEGRLEAVVV